MGADNMQANYIWHEGADQLSLAENLAGELIVKMDAAIADKGSVVLALSGGSTPKPLFQTLSEYDLDWSKVIITLVDERWVDESHALSNAAFMKTFLLNNLPESVCFIPLFQQADSVVSSLPDVLADYCKATNSAVSSPRAFDIVVLGMGEDGHTASFFPDASNVVDLLDIDNKQALLTCNSPSTQVERVTWSLPMLLNADFLALHFTGATKKQVFEQALLSDESTELPIRSVIFQRHTPLNVYYAN